MSAENMVCAECLGLTDPGDICPHLSDAVCIPCALTYPCQRCREDWADDAADTAAVDAWGDR